MIFGKHLIREAGLSRSLKGKNSLIEEKFTVINLRQSHIIRKTLKVCVFCTGTANNRTDRIHSGNDEHGYTARAQLTH